MVLCSACLNLRRNSSTRPQVIDGNGPAGGVWAVTNGNRHVIVARISTASIIVKRWATQAIRLDVQIAKPAVLSIDTWRSPPCA